MINRLKKLSPQFRKILKVSSALADSLGCSIYLIGGVVRDLILRKTVFDLDIVVENNAIVFTEKLANQLGVKFDRHHRFGTATLYFDGHKIDFATARTEKYAHWGALPKVRSSSLSKDLFRRDFSINAMAISLNKADYGALIDLYNGLDDLKKGLIRILHAKSFQDDPTRILRAIRFEQRFSFKIDPKTLELMKEALRVQSLELVGPHRLRDEIILTLKEPKPCRYIRRIKRLSGFSFLDKGIKINEESLRLFLRIEKACCYYKKRFKKRQEPETWLLYLAALLIKLPSSKLNKFFHEFGFRKKERAVICSIRGNITKIKKLNKQTKASAIYRALKPYSFESILFFHAYHQNKKVRKNIEYFLDELADISLEIKGRDLMRMGLEPYSLYSKVLLQTLYSKIDKKLKGKRKEIEEAKRIFKCYNKNV